MHIIIIYYMLYVYTLYYTLRREVEQRAASTPYVILDTSVRSWLKEIEEKKKLMNVNTRTRDDDDGDETYSCPMALGFVTDCELRSMHVRV